MKQFSLICLGIGDGWPCADRNHASFLYRLGNTSLLIDCGEPVDRGIKASGLKHEEIDGIFLSHLHSDHIGGLFMLMQGFWLEKRRKPLPIHMPGGAIEPLKAMLNAVLLFPTLIGFPLQFTPLKARKSISVGATRITPFPTSHLEGLRKRFEHDFPADFSAFCFLIESGNIRIGHSADIGEPEDLEPLLAEPLDLLVCEMSHCVPEKLFAYLQGRPIKQLVFVHLGQTQWENLPAIRRSARQMLPDIPVAFAKDGQAFEIVD